jgi:hypothetical protein
MKLTALQLDRYRRDAAAFIETQLIDPITNKPFVLLPAERAFVEHAFKIDEATGRLLFPEQIYSTGRKGGKTGYDADPTQHPDGEMPDLEEQAQQVAIEQGYFDGSIPSDISAPPGLSPKRAELARFLQWHRRTSAELEQLKVAHHLAIEALGGETVTRKKIDDLFKQDVGAVLQFVLGGEVITEAKLRSFERQQLEKKLADDRHAAQVATESLRHIEREIAIKTTGLEFLESRAEKFAKSEIIEVARELGLGELYLQKIGELREILLQLLGLGLIVGGHDGFRSFPVYEGVETQFQTFNLPALKGKDLKIVADKESLEAAAEPWRKLASEFLKNPNADAKAAYRHN